MEWKCFFFRFEMFLVFFLQFLSQKKWKNVALSIDRAIP